MDYIKLHELQQQGDRRLIQPDAKLAQLLGTTDTVNVLNLKSSLKAHFVALGGDAAAAAAAAAPAPAPP